MNKRILLIPLFILTLAVSVTAVPAQTELLAPDLAQSAIDSLAIVCQNVNDYSAALSSGGWAGYGDPLESYEKAAANLESMLGVAGSVYANRLNAVLPYFTADADDIAMVEAECIAVRRDLQNALRNQMNEIEFPSQQVTTFEDCAAFGYFVSDGVCFLNGSIAYDYDGYLIGRYNADCFDEWNNYYPSSCWYCIYGNNEEGCNARPW